MTPVMKDKKEERSYTIKTLPLESNPTTEAGIHAQRRNPIRHHQAFSTAKQARAKSYVSWILQLCVLVLPFIRKRSLLEEALNICTAIYQIRVGRIRIEMGCWCRF
jgi:hypothetical protein